MLNKIKSQFSIYDIENPSGIKAHTIRIWEKRYGICCPERNDIGVRKYCVKDLQKIFNISFLLDNGYKISKVASLSDEELTLKVKELHNSSTLNNKYINQLKIATLEFSIAKFEEVYQQLLKSKTFLELLKEVFFPFLSSIGIQWQINAITEAHEHFVSTLIKQKILIEIEKLPNSTPINDKNYVLFLPKNEMHNIAMLFIYYQMKLKGYSAIYIGENLSVAHLSTVAEAIHNAVFVTYFTILPEESLLHDYLQLMTNEILIPYNATLLLGSSSTINLTEFTHIKSVCSIEEVC